jgi:hypothetical protein
MARKTKAQKQAEAYVKKLVGNALYRNPINIFDISKVFKLAETLVAKGDDEPTIAAALKVYVESISKKDVA